MTTRTDWQRSSYCGSTTCVEVAVENGYYLVRDSKNPDTPPLRFDQADWENFLDRIKFGDYAVM